MMKGNVIELGELLPTELQVLVALKAVKRKQFNLAINPTILSFRNSLRSLSQTVEEIVAFACR